MIKWTQRLNGNEQDEREGEGMRGTSVSCCLGFNCQPKAKESALLSFSKPTPMGKEAPVSHVGPLLNSNGGNEDPNKYIIRSERKVKACITA